MFEKTQPFDERIQKTLHVSNAVSSDDLFDVDTGTKNLKFVWVAEDLIINPENTQGLLTGATSVIDIALSIDSVYDAATSEFLVSDLASELRTAINNDAGSNVVACDFTNDGCTLVCPDDPSDDTSCIDEDRINVYCPTECDILIDEDANG